MTTISDVKSMNPMAFDKGTKKFFGIAMTKILKGGKSKKPFLLEKHTEPSTSYPVREIFPSGKFKPGGIMKRFQTEKQAKEFISKN